MDFQGLGKAYEGMAKLAVVGAIAVGVVFWGAVVGAAYLAWWAWNHVSIH